MVGQLREAELLRPRRTIIPHGVGKTPGNSNEILIFGTIRSLCTVLSLRFPVLRPVRSAWRRIQKRRIRQLWNSS
jgi:hypothetical protein